MMMNFILFLSFVFLLGSGETLCQSPSDIQSRDYYILNPSIRLLEIDPLGNFYVVEETDQLSKFDTAGQLLYQVVNNNLGHVQSVDVGNPFKILVFYHDQQTMIMYDRTLSETHRIRLSDWNFQDVTAVCLSPDNAIWLFDGFKKVLVKVDNSGIPIITSDPFDIVRPPSPRPDRMLDAGHFLVLKEQDKPITIYDDFGNYLRYLENGVEHFSLSGEIIVFVSGTNYGLYDMVSNQYLNSPALTIGYSREQYLQTAPVDKTYEVQQFHLFENKIFATDHHGVFSVKIREH